MGCTLTTEEVAHIDRTIADLKAENAKLREESAKLVKVLHEVESEAVDAYLGLQHDCELLSGELEDRFGKWWHEQCENDRLRKLVRDMWRDGMCECDERGACAECEYHFPDRMRELGVEP